MFRTWRKKEARKTDIATRGGGCIKNELEKNGEKRATDRRNLKLLTENVVRGENTMDTEIMINSPLTTDAEKRTTAKCYLKLV